MKLVSDFNNRIVEGFLLGCIFGVVCKYVGVVFFVIMVGRWYWDLMGGFKDVKYFIIFIFVLYGKVLFNFKC